MVLVRVARATFHNGDGDASGDGTEPTPVHPVTGSKGTTHVAAEMGPHHAGGVAACGAVRLHRSGRGERRRGARPVLHLCSDLPGPAGARRRCRPAGLGTLAKALAVACAGRGRRTMLRGTPVLHPRGTVW